MQNNKKSKRIIRKILIVVFWIAVWAGIAVIANNKLLVATPYETAKEFLMLFFDAKFYLAVAGSLVRIALGLIAGVVIGVVLAVASYKSELVSDIFMPFVNTIKAVPVAAFVVMLLIWWGPKYLSFIICLLVVFPSIFFNTLEGLKSTDKSLLEMAVVFHLPPKTVYSYIYKPALAPFLLSAIKVALGMCWKSGVAAEVIGITEGSIGERLYMAKIYFETSQVFAWTAVIVMISYIFEKLIMEFAKWYLSAHAKVTAPKVSLSPADVIFENVSKAFGEEKVLEHVNVTYENGNVYYLNTPSGSGKTTTLNIIAGLLKADSGNVNASDNVSMAFQTDRLLEEMDAITNVAIVTGDNECAKEALLKLLDEDDVSKKVSELSGGMKRRVAVVRAMEAKSDVVLLDEPYTGMDEELIEKVKKYIADNQKGRTLIISSHI